MRIRVTFSKTDHMRFTSHLDLQRTWERTLRRARLPLAYSQGFTPRPKINLAMALPLGFTSDCEIVEFWLDKQIILNEIQARLQVVVPPGIQVKSTEEVDPNLPKIPTLVDSAEYLVALLEPALDLEQRVSEILASECLPRERRGKSYDLRPLIEALRIIPTSYEDEVSTELEMRLAARTGATGRPEEVLEVLGLDPFSARVHRRALNLKKSN